MKSHSANKQNASVITGESSIARTAKGAAAFFMALVCCLMLVPSPARALPSDDIQAQADAARARLAEVSTQLDQASDQYFTALEQHDTAVAKMNESQARIDELKTEIADSQSELRQRAISMYRGDQASMFDVLLGSASFKDFATTWNFLVTLNEDTSQLITRNKDLKAENEQMLAEYAQQEKIAADKLAEAETVTAQAESLVSQYQAEVDSLDAQVAEAIAQEEAAEMAAAQAQWNSQQQATGGSGGASQGSASGGTGGNGGSGAGSGSGGSGGSSGGGAPAYVPDYNASVADTVVSAAYSRLGCPYVWAASGPDSFDCSGLTSWCYAQAGVSVPRTSGSQRAGGTVISLSEAQPGDILWMPGHVGIYIGGGAYIHAPDVGDVVKIAYNMGMWSCAVRY